MSFDMAIENARIVDGTGSPWFRGSVGIRDGTIQTIDRSAGEIDGQTSIDADGRVLAPGFIDTHSHSDIEVFSDPALKPKVSQGITTEILGQDGFSVAPVTPDTIGPWRDHLSTLAGDTDAAWTWTSIATYLDALDEIGIVSNFATLVGHGTVRYAVLDFDDRAPTDDELEEMAEMVTDGLDAGAIGFSTGLVYPPQAHASTEELETLVRRLKPFGRPFVAHIRSESRGIWEALDEFVDIGARTGVPIHLSHYKLAGKGQHGRSDRTNALIEVARDRGVDMTAEVYPYAAGNTVLSSLLPPWVLTGDTSEVLERLCEPEIRQRIKRDIEGWRVDGWANPAGSGGWENYTVHHLDEPENQPYEGEAIASIAIERDEHPVDVVCDLLYEEDMDVTIIAHTMDEDDMRSFLRNERVCIATDGLFGTAPHPRTYGTYPRVLGRYVREENLLTLEEAIRKMTALPARIMGLDGKGLVRSGMDADLVIFDPASIRSPATYEAPTRRAAGIEYVIIDGTIVFHNGEFTGETPGTAIRSTNGQ